MTSVARPWYRGPMLWLALGIPVATVAGGIETLRLALQDGASDVEPEPVKRTAQAQEADLAPELVAAERKLVAMVSISPAGQIQVDLPGVAASEGPLTLALIHPIREHDDRKLTLAWNEGHWQATTPWLNGAWKLRLTDRQSRWRLSGRTATSATTAELDGQRIQMQSALSAR